MAKDKRVEVLFEPSEYRALEEAAHRDGKSVGAMVREAVARYVTGPTEAERKAAFEDFMSIDGGPVGSPEEIKQIIVDSQLRGILKSLGGGEPGLPEEG